MILPLISHNLRQFYVKYMTKQPLKDCETINCYIKCAWAINRADGLLKTIVADESHKGISDRQKKLYEISEIFSFLSLQNKPWIKLPPKLTLLGVLLLRYNILYANNE